MTFAASIVPGERDTRTVTITATNGSVGPAYTTLLNGFSLTQVSGPSCSPTITAPGSFPIALGDIPVSGSASASFVVSIVGCNPHSQFTLTVPWSSAVYDTGTFTTTVDFKR
jgi:endo-1,4-beta-xylanase